MKKLAFLFVGVAAVSFASCGNGTQANNDAEEDTTECCLVEDSICEPDTVAADSVAAEVIEAEAE